MLKKIVMGFGLAALLVTAALAQSAPADIDPAAKPALSADMQVAGNGPGAAPGDGNQDGGWFGWGRHGHRGHHGDMMGGPGGPGGMMQAKGFGLMLGNGQGLRITCGDEPIKQCIESAQPLIDALNKANPGQTPAVAPKMP
jgi:hypothetical protein